MSLAVELLAVADRIVDVTVTVAVEVALVENAAAVLEDTIMAIPGVPFDLGAGWRTRPIDLLAAAPSGLVEALFSAPAAFR